MMRLLLLLGFLSGLGQVGVAQDRTLMAEGDYVGRWEGRSKPLAHWKLSQLTSGEYEVTESFPNNPYLTIFRFDAQFLPIGSSMAVNPVPGPDARPQLDLHSKSLSCVYKANELACDAEYEGRKSRTSIPASQPYAVDLDEDWSDDFAWTLTGVVRVMEHTGAKETVVNAYDLKNNEAGGIALKPETKKPMTLAFVGEEKTNVMGKMQTVRRYEDRNSGNRAVLLVTMDGLVAVFSLPGDSMTFAMSNYREYKPLKLNGH